MGSGWLSRWPLVRQIRRRADGTGPEAMSPGTRAMAARTDGAEAARSVCPYCGVGCGQIAWHADGRLLAIEGDPESPINEGTLCPKGSASHELLTHAGRLRKVLHRPPGASGWREIGLDEAMDRIADLVWESRRRSFVTEAGGEPIMHTTAIAHLGGATLDNEENYLLKKLFSGGLGMVAVSNQARI